MEISTRDLVTVLHGMGFGALFMLAFSGAMAELFHLSAMPAQVRTQRSCPDAADSLFDRDGGSGVARRILGRLHCLPLVSRCSACRRHRPVRVPASPLALERQNIRVAQYRHGMEGKRGVACANRHNNGGVRYAPLPSCKRMVIADARRSAGLRGGGVHRDRNRRRLRGLPEQIRAGARRFGDHPDEG